MLYDIRELFLKDLRKQKEIYLERIGSGNVPTFDEYRYLAGIYNGINEAEAVFDRLFKRVRSNQVRDEKE